VLLNAVLPIIAKITGEGGMEKRSFRTTTGMIQSRDTVTSDSELCIGPWGRWWWVKGGIVLWEWWRESMGSGWVSVFQSRVF